METGTGLFEIPLEGLFDDALARVLFDVALDAFAFNPLSTPLALDESFDEAVFDSLPRTGALDLLVVGTLTFDPLSVPFEAFDASFDVLTSFPRDDVLVVGALALDTMRGPFAFEASFDDPAFESLPRVDVLDALAVVPLSFNPFGTAFDVFDEGFENLPRDDTLEALVVNNLALDPLRVVFEALDKDFDALELDNLPREDALEVLACHEPVPR